MSLTDHTINAQYEYRIANIVRKFLTAFIPDEFYPKTGNELEKLLESSMPNIFTRLLLDGI